MQLASVSTFTELFCCDQVDFLKFDHRGSDSCFNAESLFQSFFEFGLLDYRLTIGLKMDVLPCALLVPSALSGSVSVSLNKTRKADYCSSKKMRVECRTLLIFCTSMVLF